jgi:hypothetical protein
MGKIWQWCMPCLQHQQYAPYFFNSCLPFHSPHNFTSGHTRHEPNDYAGFAMGDTLYANTAVDDAGTIDAVAVAPTIHSVEVAEADDGHERCNRYTGNLHPHQTPHTPACRHEPVRPAMLHP